MHTLQLAKLQEVMKSFKSTYIEFLSSDNNTLQYILFWELSIQTDLSGPVLLTI